MQLEPFFTPALITIVAVASLWGERLHLLVIFLFSNDHFSAVPTVWFPGGEHPSRERRGTGHPLIRGVGSWLHIHHLISPLTDSPCQRTLNQGAFGPLHSFPLVENWLSADLIASITWADSSHFTQFEWSALIRWSDQWPGFEHSCWIAWG